MDQQTFINIIKSQPLLQKQYNILREQKKIEKILIEKEKRLAKRLAIIDDNKLPRKYHYIKPYFSRNEDIN